LHDEQPGNGAMAGVYFSPQIPSLFISSAVLFSPLLASKPTSRWLRSLASKLIRHEIVPIQIDPTMWKHYKINWRPNEVNFEVDDQVVFRSTLAPKPPLALVLWLDNQYGAWRPDGGWGYGTLPVSADSWVEIKDLRIN
jgi:hypothetical protein